MLIDSHTHLFSEKFTGHVDEVIQRAKDNGVERFVLPNIDLDSVESMLSLTKKYPNICYPTMGLHPCSVGKDFEEVLNVMKQSLFSSEQSFCAIGEIGIDLYWDKTLVNEQVEAFKIQINWAKELGLPIIIHARDSFNEIFEVIDDLNSESLKGVFHCFTGSIEQAEKIINYGGFKIGIGGVLTFKKSGLDKVVKKIPVEHLMLETDSPYLAPTPHRGKVNESSYLTYVAHKLADVKQISIDTVSEITTKNAMDLFGLN